MTNPTSSLASSSDPFHKTPLALAVASALLPAGSSGVSNPGDPVASEFLVNQVTAGDQTAPAVASAADGAFVVVWQNGADQIIGRRYRASDSPLGDEFQVSGNGFSPTVAMDADGDFVVAWTASEYFSGTSLGVYAQRYDSAGIPQGGPFQVHTFVAGDQQAPRVAMDADGDFVVAWESEAEDGSGFGIFAQRFDSAGTGQGSAFQVNQFTDGDQRLPAIAMDADGDFAVAWHSATQNGGLPAVFARRYGSAGGAQGDEFPVTPVDAPKPSTPSIAMDADGDFVIAWREIEQSCSYDYYGYQHCYDVAEINARRFDAAGLPQGGGFVVTGGDDPTVAMGGNGDFVVISNGGSARRYGADGAPQNSFDLRTCHEVFGANPVKRAAAMDADGDLLAAWEVSAYYYSYCAPDAPDIFARQFAGSENVDLSVALADNADPVLAQGVLSYTVTILNQHAPPVLTGDPAQDAYLGAVGTATGLTVSFAPPPAASVGANPDPGTDWSCAGLTCRYSGKLAAGATTSFEFEVTAPAFGGTATTTATLTGGQFDAGNADNTSSASTEISGPPPDTIPDVFTFTDQSGVSRDTEVTSAPVTITGLDAATISVTGGTYSIDGGPFTSASGTLYNGQMVRLRHTSSASFSSATHTVLTVGGVSDTFTSTTAAPDTIPDVFTFTDQSGVSRNTEVTSAPVTITGINAAAAISVTGGTYSIDGGPFTSASGTVNNGQMVRVRHTSSAGFSSATPTVLTVGGVSDTFTSTTEADPGDAIPDPFTFTDQNGVLRNTEVTSDPVTITGINVAAAISVAGGTYSIDGGPFTPTSGTVNNGQMVRVRHTSSASFSSVTNTVLTVGGVSDTFTSTTEAGPPPPPPPARRNDSGSLSPLGIAGLLLAWLYRRRRRPLA